MKTAAWIIGGLALSGAATLLSQSGATVGGIAGSVSISLPALIAGAAGQYCFWRALRSGIGDVWAGLTGWMRKSDPESPPRSPVRPGVKNRAGPESDFDADAAFARYMEQRTHPAASAETATPDPPLALVSKPRVQGGFGRKVL